MEDLSRHARLASLGTTCDDQLLSCRRPALPLRISSPTPAPRKQQTQQKSSLPIPLLAAPPCSKGAHLGCFLSSHPRIRKASANFATGLWPSSERQAALKRGAGAPGVKIPRHVTGYRINGNIKVALGSCLLWSESLHPLKKTKRQPRDFTKACRQ